MTQTLRLLTYNVWFGELAFERRARHILGLLGRAQADLISLQEVTPRFLDLMEKERWVAPYHRSWRAPSDLEPYGTVVLSRLPVQRFERVPLFSHQGRSLIRAILDEHTVVSGVHLESRRTSSEVRDMQLREIMALSRERNCVVMGDLNFHPTWPEQQAIPDEWKDSWSLANPRHDGFTYDTQENEMAATVASAPKRVRFDRILLRAPDFRVESAQRIGVEAIEEQLWPSDHYGVTALISRLP